MVPLYDFLSTGHSAQHHRGIGGLQHLAALIMRFRTVLIPDSIVFSISDWFHATFREFSFENVKIV